MPGSTGTVRGLLDVASLGLCVVRLPLHQLLQDGRARRRRVRQAVAPGAVLGVHQRLAPLLPVEPHEVVAVAELRHVVQHRLPLAVGAGEQLGRRAEDRLGDLGVGGGLGRQRGGEEAGLALGVLLLDEGGVLFQQRLRRLQVPPRAGEVQHVVAVVVGVAHPPVVRDERQEELRVPPGRGHVQGGVAVLVLLLDHLRVLREQHLGPLLLPERRGVVQGALRGARGRGRLAGGPQPHLAEGPPQLGLGLGIGGSGVLLLLRGLGDLAGDERGLRGEDVLRGLPVLGRLAELGGQVEGRLARAVAHRDQRLVLGDEELDDLVVAAHRRVGEGRVPTAVLVGELHPLDVAEHLGHARVPPHGRQVEAGADLAVHHVDERGVHLGHRPDHLGPPRGGGVVEARGPVGALLREHLRPRLGQEEGDEAPPVIVRLRGHVVRCPTVRRLLLQLPVVEVQQHLARLQPALLGGGGLVEGGPGAVDEAGRRLFFIQQQ
mmetsp:Transcript_27558/g.69547  ORF Transcript_27558/g.69547 Transcript_27558/m.69547 type:complete len:490 (-) Transcript_27558:338-1807(-)